MPKPAPPTRAGPRAEVDDRAAAIASCAGTRPACGTSCRAGRTRASARSSHRRSASSGVPGTELCALLTSTSRRPKRSIVFGYARFGVRALSHVAGNRQHFRAESCAVATRRASSFAASRPVIASFAPAPANACAMPKPTPWPAPVISATLPVVTPEPCEPHAFGVMWADASVRVNASPRPVAIDRPLR